MSLHPRRPDGKKEKEKGYSNPVVSMGKHTIGTMVIQEKTTGTVVLQE